jgi:hypothetical protein
MIKEVIPAVDSKPELLSSDYSFMNLVAVLIPAILQQMLCV